MAQTPTGIEFYKGTWQEALAKAKKEHKIIFVDAFTTWCGPCQRMAKEVFTNDEVGIFFNKHFVNVKLDMEKGEGVTFSEKYKVTSYPTLLFIDGDGNVVNTAKGARPADQFVALGKATLNRLDKTTDFEEKYEEGDRTPAFLRSYAYNLLMSGKPTLKIANEYLRTQKDLTTAENIEFIFDFCTEADSRIFDMLLQNKEQIIKAYNAKIFNEKIEQACNRTVAKSIEFANPQLLEEAKSQMKKANANYVKEYSLKADIQYFMNKDDIPKLVDACEKYLQKFGKNQANLYYQHAVWLKNYTNDNKQALQAAEKFAKKAVELEPNRIHYTLYIEVLSKNGKTAESQKMQKEAEKLPPVVIGQGHD